MTATIETGSVTWRSDIDALSFQPPGHEGRCMVHRLAFRSLIGSEPTPGRCLDYFAEHREGFLGAAAAKIALRGIETASNFHLTSRDIRRVLSTRVRPPPQLS